MEQYEADAEVEAAVDPELEVDADELTEVIDVVDLVDEDDAGVEEEILVLEEASLPIPVWEPTGDAAVDAALDELARLDDAALADHLDIFNGVHAALHQRLSDLGS